MILKIVDTIAPDILRSFIDGDDESEGKEQEVEDVFKVRNGVGFGECKERIGGFYRSVVKDIFNDIGQEFGDGVFMMQDIVHGGFEWFRGPKRDGVVIICKNGEGD